MFGEQPIHLAELFKTFTGCRGAPELILGLVILWR